MTAPLDLREALIACLAERFNRLPGQCGEHADALIAGPMKEHITDTAELHRLRKENDYLRASLANGSGPCAYCKLPREEWAKCSAGFPGCPRADDADLCQHVGAWLEVQEKLTEAESHRDAYRAAHRALWTFLDPFVAHAACVARYHPGWDHDGFELFHDTGFGALTMGIFRQAHTGRAEADEALRQALDVEQVEQGEDPF